MISNTYTKAASYFHWITAVPLISSIGCVIYSQQLPKSNKKEKGEWMWRHKSLGLLTGLIITPRLVYRTINNKVYKSVPSLHHHLGKVAGLSHFGLYTFGFIMPLTGIAMGMFGGNGLPFFWTKIPGLESKNKNVAANSFNIHKTLGMYGKFLIPIHTGAALGHATMGQKI